MKQSTLLQNIIVAVLLTLTSIPARFIIQIFFDATLTSKICIAMVSMLYIGICCYKSPLRTGRITLSFSVSAILTASIYTIDQPINLLIAIALVIWISRSLLYYSSIISVAADFSLCVISSAAAIWTFSNNGNLAVAIWCFLLIQALHALIPGNTLKYKHTQNHAHQKNHFNHALQTAEAALKKIATSL